uniref:Putative ixodes 8-cys protein n=1 Tax=Ixodes ricinus TaxID=34613 RepID=A0A0K8R8S8_IXORI
MLNLRIFILLVLAGLCFGASLEEPQSSGDNSQDSGPPAEPQPSAQAEESNKDSSQNKENDEGSPKEEKPEGSEPKDGTSDGNSENEEQNDESATKGENRKIGYELPDFVGDANKKRSYVLTLLANCDKQNQMYKVNERDIKINFKNCSYTCMGLGIKPQYKVERIPEGLVCDIQNMTCPSEGNCPDPPLPSC